MIDCSQHCDSWDNVMMCSVSNIQDLRKRAGCCDQRLAQTSVLLVLARVLLVTLGFFVTSSSSVTKGDDGRAAALDEFENAIRPLLVTHCIECHGPTKAESGLRFDTDKTTREGGDSGPVISLDQPEQSLMLQALRHVDGLEMPPDGKLPEHQIALVEDWIRGGAVWPDNIAIGGAAPQTRGGELTADERAFWSFQPIVDSPPPDIADGIDRCEIDRFLTQKLNEATLKPMPPATRQQWIRRVTFDLTGLPPTADMVEEFVTDRSASAYTTVIDRLLDSKTYGERWGRHWLDVVRYADTAGETADYPTPLSYKYRNWVIDAFNADMPYDEFVQQQIAGDLLADQLIASPSGSGPGQIPDELAKRYRDMRTATGFIAISRRFGFDVENYHHLTIQDTIDVVGQSMLGLTLGCARCHDHKFDPVNMQDYYAWYGIFDSTKYSFPGSEEKKRPYDLLSPLPAALMAERQREHDSRLASLDDAIAQVDADLKGITADIDQIAGAAGFFGFEQCTLGQPPSRPFMSLGTATIAESAQSPFNNLFPSGTRGITFPSNTDNNAFGRTLASVFTPESTQTLYYNIDFRNRSMAAGGQQAYRFYIGHGPGTSGAVEMATNHTSFLIKDGDHYEPIAKLEMGQWYNLQVTLDLKLKHFKGKLTSSSGTTEIQPQAFTTGWDGIIDYTFVDKYGPGSGATPAHDIDNLRIDTTPLLPQDHSLKSATVSPEQPLELAAKIDSQQRLQQRLDEVTKQRDTLKSVGPIPVKERLYGAIEQDAPKNAQIQLRGEITRLGNEVPRRNLDILGGQLLQDPAASGRRQLADWITRDENPLFARVMVNRIWQQHFGRGLVGTENDFGTRGERPSHPELLDWLASRFKESGYSVKSMHRLIINSAAYRRASTFDEASAKIDPDARLLWRFNRRRLSAEEIRDAMLRVGGNLDQSMAGEHPFPAMDTWGFSQHAPFYGVYSTNRRSVYLMRQRLKRHPFLGLFDGADTNASTARRELTTVPTQALFLMNNEFVHEQAASFTKRICHETDDDTLRVERAHLIALGRSATPTEQEDARNFLATYQQEAIALQIPKNESQRTAWEAYARTMLTRNEFLFVD